jgi:hypothetical protein
LFGLGFFFFFCHLTLSFIFDLLFLFIFLPLWGLMECFIYFFNSIFFLSIGLEVTCLLLFQWSLLKFCKSTKSVINTFSFWKNIEPLIYLTCNHPLSHNECFFLFLSHQIRNYYYFLYLGYIPYFDFYLLIFLLMSSRFLLDHSLFSWNLIWNFFSKNLLVVISSITCQKFLCIALVLEERLYWRYKLEVISDQHFENIFSLFSGFSYCCGEALLVICGSFYFLLL